MEHQGGETTVFPYSLFVHHYDLKEQVKFSSEDCVVSQAIMFTLSQSDREF